MNHISLGIYVDVVQSHPLHSGQKSVQGCLSSLHQRLHLWTTVPSRVWVATFKSRDEYHHFFMGVKKVMKIGQHISPEEIMGEFELVLVQPFELEFPGACIHGCYFHFAQCLWRKGQRFGLV